MASRRGDVRGPCLGRAFIRLRMARESDFWLDEIWSWWLAQSAHSAWDVFTHIHHDNNHYLNTLWLWWLGKEPRPLLSRAPSLVAGVGAVFLLGRIAARRGQVEAIFATALGATSYLLRLYSSGARGYMPAVFCALLCVDRMQAMMKRPRLRDWLLFQVAAIAGLLSHLTFVHPYAGVVAYEIATLRKQGRSWSAIARTIVRDHAPLGALLAALYWLDLRKLTIGGGGVHTFSWLLGQTSWISRRTSAPMARCPLDSDARDHRRGVCDRNRVGDAGARPHRRAVRVRSRDRPRHCDPPVPARVSLPFDTC